MLWNALLRKVSCYMPGLNPFWGWSSCQAFRWEHLSSVLFFLCINQWIILCIKNQLYKPDTHGKHRTLLKAPTSECCEEAALHAWIPAGMWLHHEMCQLTLNMSQWHVVYQFRTINVTLSEQWWRLLTLHKLDLGLLCQIHCKTTLRDNNVRKSTFIHPSLKITLLYLHFSHRAADYSAPEKLI